MKKILFLQVVMVMTLSYCSRPKERIPEIVLNDSAFIKLTVINCRDTAQLHYKTVPLLPIKCVINNTDITKDGIYYFSHKTVTPDLIEITLKKRFQTYVIPGDTLKITCNLDPDLNENEAIKIEGVFGIISDYFSKKHDILGYWEISQPLTEFANIKYPLERAIFLTDSLFQSEAAFLDDYNNRNKLPNWFYEILKSDIDYFKVAYRPSIIGFRKFFFKDTISNPKEYYNFEKISLYNPRAKLSRYYYDCIGLYFMVNNEEGLENKSGTSRALPLFERSIPEVKKTLKGDILEYYLAFKTSELFEASRSVEELQQVDSLFIKIQSQFTQHEIIRILEKQREDRTEFLTKRTNIIPFTTTIFEIKK